MTITTVNHSTSGTSNSTKPTKVRIAANVTIYNVKSYKDTQVWYTCDELNLIEAENKSIGQRMIQQQQLQQRTGGGRRNQGGSPVQYSGSIIESVDCTTRGLERFYSSNSSLSMYKAMGQRSRQSVLEEQDRQRVLQQVYATIDSDLHVADAYSFLSAPSKREALCRAMYDAQEIAQNDSLIDDDGGNVLRASPRDNDCQQKEQYLVRSSVTA